METMERPSQRSSSSRSKSRDGGRVVPRARVLQSSSDEEMEVLEVPDGRDFRDDLSVYIADLEDDDRDSPHGAMDHFDETAFMDPNETRRILNEMIDTCQELEDKQGFQENEDDLIRMQVVQSKLMFESQFKRPNNSLNSSMDDSENRRRRSLQNDIANLSLSQAQESMVVADAKPTDMYLSYKHTNMCAGLMRKRVQNLGIEESILTIDGYLNALKEKAMSNSVGEDGNIDEDIVNVQVMELTANCWKTAQFAPMIIGAFDYREFLERYNENEIKAPKEKKTIQRRRQFNEDVMVATQQEVNISQLASQANRKKQDEVGIKFRQDLKKFCGKEGGDLFSFTLNKDSVRESINNTFGVAFGIRDGSIELATGENNLLKITPCTPPDDPQHNMSNRRQCILSVSAGMLKKMQKEAQGENALQEMPPAKPV